MIHAALAEVLSEPPTMEEFDMDSDGKPTLLDFYLTLTRNIAQRYVDANLLATEHSVLDDNGDGRGLEIQIDYLTVEQGGREHSEDEPLPKIRPNSDGFRSQQFDFSMLTLSEPMEEPAEEDETAEEEPAEDEPEPEEEPAESEDPAEEPEADMPAEEESDVEPEADDTESGDEAESDDASSGEAADESS